MSGRLDVEDYIRMMFKRVTDDWDREAISVMETYTGNAIEWYIRGNKYCKDLEDFVVELVMKNITGVITQLRFVDLVNKIEEVVGSLDLKFRDEIEERYIYELQRRDNGTVDLFGETWAKSMLYRYVDGERFFREADEFTRSLCENTKTNVV